MFNLTTTNILFYFFLYFVFFDFNIMTHLILHREQFLIFLLRSGRMRARETREVPQSLLLF